MLTLVFLSLLSVAFTSPYTIRAQSTTNSYRLPNTTLPSKYRINLEVPEDSLIGRNTNFRGFVEIDFIVTKPSNKIYINSVVNVSNIFLRDAEQNVVPIFKFVEKPRTEMLLILLKTELVISTKYVLKIYYIGNLTTRSIQGPARIEYIEDGSKEYLIVTQFESGYARYAFPCFDEPPYKAKFILSITYPKEYRAMSNRPEAKTTTKNNYKTTEFQESPKMSTYLLAFAISKFTCTKSANSDGNVSLSVCSRDKFATNRALALDYGPKIINAMSAWTNYNYSKGNNQMVQFSLPGLTELAMENWGFVTYQEYMLLWDQKETSNEFKQTIIELIAHEFSHQWFGNLVTTSWWDTLFLNEGFATYFQYHLLNLIGLENYEMEKQFIILQQQTVLMEDGFNESSSLTSAAETNDEIEEKFGTIAYNKGASIIKMIENLLGPKNFQESLRHYLKKYAFQVTTPQNLWDSLSTSIKKGILPENVTFTNFIDNWTNKGGFPVVRVALKGNDVILSQKRFLYEGETKDQWYIPITYITSNSDSYKTVWLKPSESLTLKKIVTNNGWIVVNHNSRGYFRVRYNSIIYHRLSKALKSNAQQFTDLDRAQIVDDTFNLALAGQISYLEVFQIIDFLKNETSYYPWNAAFRGFNEITSRFKDDSEIVKHINSVVLNLVEAEATNISVTNWERIDHVSSLKLPLVWMAACKAGQKKCVLETKRLFKEFKENGVSLNPNIRQVVYCNALKYGDDIYGDWHFLWNKSLTIDQPHEKMYILTSLACTTSEHILAYYLKTSLSSPLDFQVIWDSVYLSSSLGFEVAFNYFLENHSDILTFSYEYGTTVLANILERLFTQDQINRLQNFIDDLDEDSDIKSFAQAFVEDAETNLRLQARIKSDLERNFGIRPSIVTQS